MNSFWPSTGLPPEETAPEHDVSSAAQPMEDVADTGPVAEVGPEPGAGELEKPPVPPPPPPPPSRPGLARNAMQAGPPNPLPPPPQLGYATPGREKQQQQQQYQQQQQQQQQQQGVPAPTDSMSLHQLRRIVAEVNRPEPVSYDYAYTDMGPHAEEIDEWFAYQFWQWVRLNAAQKAFDWHLNHESAAGPGGCHAWEDADNDTRARFVQAAIAGVQSNDAALRSASIGKLVYLVLGRWGDTAMSNMMRAGAGRSVASPSQLQAIKAGVECLTSLEGLPVIWEALQNCFEVHWSGEIQQQASPQEAQDELMNLMTIMYIAIQETLSDPEDMASSYGKLLELNPSLVDVMLKATSKLRWDEQNIMPHTQIFLLFWKSILLVFGGTKELINIKLATGETCDAGKDKELITASPLDYHAFRREIISKYPAYVPPQPLIPLEADNSSLLPPLPHQLSRNSAPSGIIPMPAQAQIGGASILDQPVHIATPAPSPPPSPGVGGKGGKKQNYQTNQNFPFMYPPLDATSNSAGGKGMSGAHDAIVSRRWEGSDIPASILEAGELFSSRVRMSRATRQMWDERERFLKHERGWEVESEEDIFDTLDLSDLTLEEQQAIREIKNEDKQRNPPPPAEADVDFGPNPDRLSERDKQRLIAVERFYKEALPHLQSLVIVLLRPILVNVTAIVTQQATQNPNGMAGRGGNPGLKGGGLAMQRGSEAGGSRGRADEADMSPEEVDAVRTREITAKAMTGILILLLKWLRVSHVLKFEYLTQLLLDSNYVPLVLKLFAHQDIQQVVDSQVDRVESSFFQFCNLRSKFKDKIESDLENEDEEDETGAGDGQVDGEPGDADDSDDSAAPAPIKRRRSPEEPEGVDEGDADAGADTDADADDDADADADVDAEADADADGDGEGDGDGDTGSDGLARPEVDELGCAVDAAPAEPITDFSRRNFFSLINYLRIMQKICKGKAHRNLLLVQYKSSTILRKSLRIPQEELRLYTLKLVKSQVPYCGRKWRQSNMRVITAVYLHCRPELRDEWLAGSDVDADVEGALPLEQGLRSLTHWRNVRRYPDQIAPDIRAAMREEQDFFTRELEKLDVNWADAAAGEGVGEMEHVEGWA